jgi:hypothetical protein
MKNLFIAASIMLLTASCLSQPAPTEPKAPKQPATPTPPTRPVKPVPAARLAEQEQKLAQNLDRLDEELAKTKWDLLIADPSDGHDDSNRTLVIPQDPGEAKNQSETEEDLNVMAHILEKASTSRDERNARSLGIFFRSPFGSSPALRNLYLEGYGAVFFLNVNYSLTPAPPKADDADAREDAASEWEEARREVTQPRASGTTYTPVRAKPSGHVPEYDADKVENLKKNLSQALKNAVHIRKLKSDETITIVVTSRSPSAMKLPKVKTGNRTAADASASQDKLVIRAKKTDIEAFQNEKLAFEDFRKKVTIFLD